MTGARTAAIAALALLLPAAAPADEPLRDAPVIWWADDRRDIPEPAERDPNLLRDQIHTTLVRPVRRHSSPGALVRRLGTAFGKPRWPAAHNVNVLDEVPNSTWFTNRIGVRPMTPEEAAAGPGDGRGPDRSVPWVVVSAKTEGVTPGFNIRDGLGDVYLIKFDPKGFRGTTTGPGVISGRILHAAGYNVPDDAVVSFRREDLVLGKDVMIKVDGVKRAMTGKDLDAILARVDRDESGAYPALSSKFLPGKPVGPFDYKSTRKDDPNDRIRHEHRRELRGLRVFAAWLGHFDTKQHNTLDMYVEENGNRFVKHHLIDFASTLGSGASGASPKYNWEYGFDGPATLRRLVTLGLVEDEWRTFERPEDLPEVGYFESEPFAVSKFEPLTPNSAFARMTDRDGYWAAKIVSGFSNRILTATTRTAGYENPDVAPYLARVLAERRDIIARDYFTRVCPVDFFRVRGGHLAATDLGVDRGIWDASATSYRVRQWPVDPERNATADIGGWTAVDVPEVGLGEGGAPYRAVEFQVDRGDGWGPSVIVYVAAASGRVVGVER